MKKILLLLLLIVFIYAVFQKKSAYFGFEESEIKTYIYVTNNTQKDLDLKLSFSISSESPNFRYKLKSKERKELVIDWDLVRKVDAWGEGNIWLHVYEKEKEIDKIFLGEIELYEDGRNFIKGLQKEVVIEEQSATSN